MDAFEFCLPTRFVFGKGAENEVGRLVTEAGGSKALVLYGGGSCVRSGLLARVEEALASSSVVYVKLGGVAANPESDLVYRGIELARAEGVDFVLALGGGSVIDTAKAVAAGTLAEGDFWEFFYEGDAEPEIALPVGCVPTIAAAGSEASPDSVITHSVSHLKRETSSDALLPAFAAMNPALTMTCPPYQTASGIVDMYSHLLERYLSASTCTWLNDRQIEGLMRGIVETAPVVMADPNDYQGRANLQWASVMAHNNVAGVGRRHDWASHEIEYALTSRYGVSHGAGLAIVMPAVMEYYLGFEVGVARLSELARRVWDVAAEDDLEAARAGIEAQRAFFSGLGMPITLEDAGGSAKDIVSLVHETLYEGGRTGSVGGFIPLADEAVSQVFLNMLSKPES